jgi:hypothetical protein
MKPIADRWRLGGLILWALLMASCASHPPAPHWQLEAKAASERFVTAYWAGNTRAEALEFAKARHALASTGRPDLLARLELLRCATRVASLVFEPCAGFEALRIDAAPPERAYANYLAGQLAAGDMALLPPAQQAVTAAAATGPVLALPALAEPLSQLVAAGVLLRAGQVSPAVLEQAVQTASAQGWRRPLLAWLGAQALSAQQAGDLAGAERLRRRMDAAARGSSAPRAAP